MHELDLKNNRLKAREQNRQSVAFFRGISWNRRVLSSLRWSTVRRGVWKLDPVGVIIQCATPTTRTGRRGRCSLPNRAAAESEETAPGDFRISDR